MGAQEVFAVFFAIAWATAAYAQASWKAFDYTSDKLGNRVICLSWPVLNLLPIWAFLHVYGLLENQPATFLRVVPALMPFGFYKVWLGLVQSKVLYERVYSETERAQLENHFGGRQRDGAETSFTFGIFLIVAAYSLAKYSVAGG